MMRLSLLGLRTQLAIAFLVLSLLIVGALAYLNNRSTTAALTRELGNNLAELASSKSLNVGSFLVRRVNTMQALALSKFTQDELAARNAAYGDDAVASRAELARLDRQWVTADADDPLVQAHLNSALAMELQELQDAFPEFAEVFVTDRYGGLVAATGRTSDYYQADEPWWQVAFNSGRGAVYIGTPMFDESSQVLGINLAVPVYAHRSQEVIGVLRTTLDAAALVNLLGVAKVGQVDLLFPDGTRLTWGAADLETLDPSTFAQLSALPALDPRPLESAGSRYVEMVFEGEPNLIIVTRVVPDTGEQFVAALGWKVVFRESQARVLAPVAEQSRGAALLATLVGGMAIVAAVMLSRQLAAPITRLTRAATRLAAGDLSVRANPSQAVSELRQLTDTFNQMAEALQARDAETKRATEANLFLLERAIASSSSGLIITDHSQPDDPIIYVNPAFEQLTGYSKEEALGRNLRFLQGDDVDQPGLTELRAALREARDCRVVLRNYRKDGSLFWNELYVSPVRDTTGRLTHFVGAQNDITELKLVEEAVRVSEERFRQLADHVREVFWVVTPDWSQMLYVNPAYEEMWGRTCESLYRDPSSFLDAIHPEDCLSIVELIQGQQMEKPVFVEFRIVRPDGSPGWIWTRAFPIRSPSGKTYRIVGLSEEVTERKQAEEDIRKALAKERELGELKSRFISMASHEFRTPLSAILTSAELVEHHGHKLTEEKKLRHLRQVQASVKSMTQLLDDVLIIGKAEAGKLEFNPVPVDLVQFCYDLVEEVQLSAGAKHAIHFAVRGPCAEAYVDEKLLRQILANLLSNAIKYSPQGSRVGFEVQCENGQAIFKIQDEGIGIPLEEQARLFDTFHRATNVGTIPGTGLGLAIVKRSVDLHGGTIAFTSAVGAGTTFTVAIPLRPSSEEKNT